MMQQYQLSALDKTKAVYIHVFLPGNNIEKMDEMKMLRKGVQKFEMEVASSFMKQNPLSDEELCGAATKL